MSQSNLDFVNEKFDSIDQTKIYNSVNENLKKNDKGNAVFYQKEPRCRTRGNS